MTLTNVPQELSSTPSIEDEGTATAIEVDANNRVKMLEQMTATKGIHLGGTSSDYFLNSYRAPSAFTPTISQGASSVSYSTQHGWATKIGDIVLFSMYLIVTGGSGNSAQLKFGGLPYTSSSTTGKFGGALWSYGSMIYANSLTGTLGLHITTSSDAIECYDGSSLLRGDASAVSIQSSALLVGFYHTDS